MSGGKPKRRVSREDWLQAGLEVLSDAGVDAVKIDRLARQLGVAKTGFYWHFKNRDELLEAMLDYWEREYTDVVANNATLTALPPAERLVAISEMISEHWLAQYDPAMAVWARQDERAAQLLKHTYAVRLKTMRGIFKELGFSGDDLEMRVRLFTCYHSSEDNMFGLQTDARAKRLRKLRVRLLTQPLASVNERD